MAAAPEFDLQCHSLCSDGTLAPGDVVAAASRAGVALLALTDHDTVAGVAEARRAARDRGVVLVAAAEISAVDAGHEDLHMLGYLIDPSDRALLDALESFRADRHRRATAMLGALRECGLAAEDPQPQRASDHPIGRPHIAAAAFAHPDNARRLAEEGIESAGALLEAYLIPGAPAYRPRERPTVAEAIALVHGAGGVAVWAHPFWNMAQDADVGAAVARYAAAGLDGVEVFYPTHTREQVLALHSDCHARGLLMTGSSDFHGPQHPLFGRFRAFELHGLEPALGPIAGAAR